MNKFGNLITFNKKEQYAHQLGISDNLKKENSKTYKKLNRIFMPALLDVYSKKRVTKDL